MSCSMIAWAAVPIASLASFCSSARKSTNFWFAGLKTSFWNLYFAVAIDWGFTYFLRKTARISPKFSRIGPLIFFENFVARLPSWENGSSWFCHLRSADYEFWDSSGIGLQTAQIFQISLQTWASLWLVTLAVWKFCWCYYESSQEYFYLSTAEGPTKFGRLRLTEGYSHCGLRVDW